MSLGEKLLDLRRKASLSQEEVATRLGVSRQTVSKWETGQTVPELSKVKLLSELYHVSYDYFISSNIDSDGLTSMEALVEEIDWTSAWSKKYPILASYQNMEKISEYQERINQLFDDFKSEFELNDRDTVLVLKDILYQKYKSCKKNR